MKTKLLAAIITVLILMSLSGCSGSLFAIPSPTATSTALPTNTPLPTNTHLPTATSTATPVPYYATALVLSGEIQAPAILYHRIGQDTHDPTSTWTRRSDFKAELQKLYDAGYSLVSMSSWLDGSFTVPAGRKPLLFTMDDGISSDQIYINDDGTPSQYSGLGMLYQFSQDHPDFGFAASIYVNMGDKYYGDELIGDWFYVSDGNGWKTKLANTMVWMIEHNVEIYNHTYTHVDLSLTKPDGIEYQLQYNDKTERNFLALVNRSDLDEKLGNIVALPFGIWPSTQAGMDTLLNYTNPEGKPLSAILEAYNADEPKLTPSVFSSSFDRMSLPRITAMIASVDWMVAHKDETPTMQSCLLGPTSETEAKDSAMVQSLISSAVQTGTCPEGVYHINGQVYIAQGGSVTLYSVGMTLTSPTSTPAQ